ncbi:putative small secreted protein [Arthrobacter sp. CAN_A6]|uniref:hypothetical protein n=1 Tax=Arthrobacter sp. CAN_A6 TaxID=2787721 RepID=UPI0018C933C1
MRKTTRTCGVLLAASLFLTSCGETPAGPTTDTAPPESTPAAPAATPSTSTEPTPTIAAAKTYTNEELTALVASLTDINGNPLTVVPAEQLDQAVAAAKALVATATITPEACNVFAAESTPVPDGSTYAAGASLAAAEKTQTTITVIAVQDLAVLADEVTASQDAVDQCATYEIEKDGEKISSQVTPIEATTDGEMSFGALTTQSLATGEKQMIMSISGTKGTLGVTAVKIGAEIAPEAQAELEQLINDALAKG